MHLLPAIGAPPVEPAFVPGWSTDPLCMHCRYELKVDNAILAEEKHLPLYKELVDGYKVRLRLRLPVDARRRHEEDLAAC